MNLLELETEGLLDLELVRIGGVPLTVASLLTCVLIMLVTLWVSWLVRKAIHKALLTRGRRDEGTVGVASRLVHYSILFTGFSVGLNTLGINLTALFAAGALFAVALGFAMQNMTENFVSGVIVLLERAIKPGDILEVEGDIVRVREMGMRATIARTLDEEDIVIPNSILVRSSVRNYTLRDHLYRLRTLVGVTYSTDMRLARQVLEEAAAALDWRTSEPEPAILLVEFGNSSVNFEVSVWMDDPWRMRRRLSDLNEAIWWALQEAGVVIAFPQVDVHLDTPVEESLAALKAS